MKLELSIIGVSCDGCGACCMHMRTPPFIRHGDDFPPAHLEAEVRAAVFESLRTRPDTSPCLWLDLETKKCKHYEHRPQVCREFERGSEDCLRICEETGVR